MSMMWKESNVRRSPRISGLNLNACEGQQQMGRVKVDSTKKSTAANANAVAVGPASRTRARKKRKLKPLQDVAAANTTFVSPISQEVCFFTSFTLSVNVHGNLLCLCFCCTFGFVGFYLMDVELHFSQFDFSAFFFSIF